MKEYRSLVTQPDLNAHGTLHGGILVKWVDEACGMEARLLTSNVCATRHIGEIDFISKAALGDVLGIMVDHVKTGKTSLTFSANVYNLTNACTHVANFEKLVFVAVDKDHKPIKLSNT